MLMISGIHLSRFAIIAAFAFTSLHAAEPKQSATPAPVVKATTVSKATPSDATEITDLRKQADDNARDKAIAEAKLEVISAGNSRMEILIGAFGVLITVVLFGFGIATYKTAGVEAAKAATDAIQAQKEALEKISIAAAADAAVVADVRKQIELSPTAQAAINKPPSDRSASSLPKAEAEELTTAATVAKQTPRNERTAQEFRILMFDAKQAGEWHDYFDLAEGMAYLHGDNPADLAYALFSKAFAAHKLDDHVLAARLYEDYLTRCPDDIPNDRANALSNWSAALLAQANTKSEAEADALFVQVEEKLATALAIKPDYSVALSNWGTALSTWANTKNGDEAEALFAQAETKLLEAERIESGAGAYNLACMFGLRGDPDKASKWLIISKERGVLFPGCAHIGSDSDFDAVRDSPVFKAALAEIGC
jgi:hypothetical protein